MIRSLSINVILAESAKLNGQSIKTCSVDSSNSYMRRVKFYHSYHFRVSLLTFPITFKILKKQD